MDEMREAGYDGVELGPWGYFPNKYPQLKEELDQRGLELVAGTVGGDFLDDASVDDMCRTIDHIAELLKNFPQAKYIVLLPSMYTDLETGEYGLIGTFHPHVDCHVQTEEQIEALLRDTSVQLCFDTGHHVYRGGEPVAFYEKHADRIPYIHIKDCDLAVKEKMDKEKWSFAKAVTENIMVEPGKGSIDFARLHKVMEEKNYEGWVVVEQDLFPVKSFDVPLPIAKRGRENLAKAGF